MTWNWLGLPWRKSRKASPTASRNASRTIVRRSYRPLLEALEDRLAPAVSVPSGFANIAVVSSGLASPTSLETLPDGRVLIGLQNGTIRVVENDSLLSQSAVNLGNVDSGGERGLLGITYDPNFASNHYIYVYYTAAASANPSMPFSHNRFSRLTLNGNTASNEQVLWEFPDHGSGIWHMGGSIQFGPDGKLYVSVGQVQNTALPQSLNNPFGKIHRFDVSGTTATIPIDNPFYNTATGNNRSIWALGLRNPYTTAFQPGTGLFYLNDVGEGSFEEINQGQAGANYGWPATEGTFNASAFPNYTNPIYAYPHGADCAITGGDFYNPQLAAFPSQYVGKYFFEDFCGGWIKTLDPVTKQVSNFATGLEFPNDMRVSDSGAIYYLVRGADTGGQPATGGLGKIVFVASQVPLITSQPASQTFSVGETATLSVTATGPGTLSYQWQKLVSGSWTSLSNGGKISGATSATLSISSVASGDGGNYRVIVTNSFGTTTSNEAVLTITTNQRPTATITAPPIETTFQGGSVINYAGTGSDPEDGAITNGSQFTWQVDFHHDSHVHPFVAPTSGSTSGSFTIPFDGHPEGTIWYRIYLTVTDSQGLSKTTFRDVTPQLVPVTLNTNIAGLHLNLDGQPKNVPYNLNGVVNTDRTIEAPLVQTVGGTTYEFVQWADDALAPATRTVRLPSASVTYTALYKLRLFDTAAGYTTGTNSHGVTARDLNGDGKTDLAVANAGSDTVSVLLGNGNGTFAAAVNYAVGDQPKAVVAADLNGDNKLDLVTANQGPGTVSVLLNQGNGTYFAAVDYTATSGAHEAALADLDGDNDIDIAVTGWGASLVRVLFNQGNGTFTVGTTYTVGSQPHSVVAADFSGDNKPDLAVANRSSSSVAVLINNGTGTFAPAVFYSVGSGPHSIRFGDLTGDGKLDLATANEGANTISVLVGNGTGGFASAVHYATGPVPKGVAIGDVNGDGKLDLLSANTAGNYPNGNNPGGDTISVLLNNGNGTFGIPHTFTTGRTPFSIALADFDLDGDLDAATANWHTNNVAVLDNLTIDAPPPPPEPFVYVSDLAYTVVANGWGPAEKDTSNGEQAAGDGSTITLGGVAYAKGLGVHAASEITVPLNGQYTTFLSDIGVDDEVGVNGSVIFQVWADGVKLYESPLLTGSSATVPVSVDVTGRNQLRLVVTTGLNTGNAYDHADWANARLMLPASNQPPEVTEAAHAHPLTSTTQTVHVEATDDGGAENLTYTWSVVGTPPASVSFSPNSSNAANTTTATFGAAGTYTLRVTITDAENAQTTSDVEVTVSQVLTSITVSPASAGVTIGGTQQFSAVARDQFNNAMSVSIAWSIDSGGVGTIDASGLYTAPGQSGSATVRATSGAVSGTASVTVAPASVYVSDLSYTVVANGWGPVEKDKSNGEQAAGDGRTITLNGATYAKGLGTHAASDVTVALNGQYNTFLSDVGVDDEVGTNGSVIFQVWADGTKLYESPLMTGTSTTQSVSVDVTGRNLLRLVVTTGLTSSNFFDHADWANARLVAAPVNQAPQVTTAAQVQATTATTATLHVGATDDGGEPNLSYSWSAVGTPPASVTFSPNGSNGASTTTATFAAAGTYTLRVTITDQGNAQTTSDVEVTVNQVLSTITVSPVSASLGIGGTQQFSAAAADQFGNSMSVPITWSIDSGGVGAIDTTGLYTAPGQSGTATVRATSDAISGTSLVTVGNSAPQVTTAAQVQTTTPTTATLLVGASDDGGEPNLIYTWSVVGNPPGSVTFSANGSNAASATTATFGAAGTYTLRVTITDQENAQTTSDVEVTVNQVLTGITVSPASVTLIPGATQQLSAAAVDQFGNPMSVAYTWSVDSGGVGSIDTSGLYTAPAQGGTATVRATSDTISGTASVTVNAPPQVTTAAQVQTSTPTTATLHIGASDDGGEPNLTYSWSVLGNPPGSVTFSANGSNAASTTTATFGAVGTYTLRVTITDQANAQVTSDVEVTVSQVVSSITVTPSSATVNTGATQQFTAAAKDQFNNVMTVPFTWSVDSGGVGTIDSTGLYQAPSTGGGTATVRATSGTISGTASVTINTPPTVTQAAQVIGTTATTATLNVAATDNGGASNLTYAWSVVGTPPAPVTFSPNGTNAASTTTATFAKAGSYTLRVTIRDQFNAQRTSQVTHTVSQVLTSITVTPSTATVNSGATQQFSAAAKDQFNNPMTVSYTWSIDSGGVGTINSTGLYQAPSTGGGTAKVRATSGSVSGTATVTVPIYVSNLAYTVVANGWGPVEKDKSNGEKPAGDGKTITLNGVTYAKGLGVHASSDVRVPLNGQYATFLTDIGVDDEVGSKGSVIFQIWADGVKLYESPLMTGTSATRSVSVDVTGRTQLRLVVTTGLDSNKNDDHADWANARLIPAAASQAAQTSSASTSSPTSTASVTVKRRGR